MTGSHTPGPWLRHPIDRDGPDCGVTIVGGNLGGLVGAAQPWPTEIDSGDFSRVEANARLIAAAPDGLELAEEFLAFARSGATFSYPSGSLQKLEQFIARAKGTCA